MHFCHLLYSSCCYINNSDCSKYICAYIFSFVGTSDPYVKFKISGKQLYKSRTVNRTLEPYWDEFFTIPVEDVFEPLHVRVFDYDFALQDDYMGSAQIDLTQLELNRYFFYLINNPFFIFHMTPY